MVIREELPSKRPRIQRRGEWYWGERLGLRTKGENSGETTCVCGGGGEKQFRSETSWYPMAVNMQLQL